MAAITEWLAALSLSEYAERFIEADIDLDVLPELSDRDLESLGISLGHRRKIMRAIRDMSRAGTGAEARTGRELRYTRKMPLFRLLVGEVKFRPDP